MLTFFLYNLVKSFPTDAEEVVTELPRCTTTREVRQIKSEILRRIIYPGDSYCIRGIPSSNGQYPGNLYFVFNELSGLVPAIYYNRGGTWIKRTPADTLLGGASTGQYEGFLYLQAPDNESAEFNIGYTTFDRTCERIVLSGCNDEYLDIDVYPYLRKLNCYFNGNNGGQEITIYTNNSLSGCYGSTYPKSPQLESVAIPLNFVDDQGSPQFAKFICTYSSRRIISYIEVDGRSKKDNYVFQSMEHTEFIYPDFYTRTKHKSNLGLILGLSLGIPLGIGLIIFIAFAAITRCFTDCCDDCCDCCDCCDPCSCTMDIVPKKLRENIIKEYSYSDDVKPLDNVPEYNDHLAV